MALATAAVAEIAVIGAERLVHAMRTDIANHCRQARGELTLHVKVPLHHVVTLRVVFNEAVFHSRTFALRLNKRKRQIGE